MNQGVHGATFRTLSGLIDELKTCRNSVSSEWHLDEVHIPRLQTLGQVKLSPTLRSASRSGSLWIAASNRSIGSVSGSSLKRKV